ncbi:MAG: hypothetical protein RR056_06705 [Acetivibrio sp.]
MYTSVCKHCKKIFKTPIHTVCCNDCRAVDKDGFEDVKKYLEAFPNSNAMQISNALEIPITTILQYIEDGYLWPVNGSFEKLSEESLKN